MCKIDRMTGRIVVAGSLVVVLLGGCSGDGGPDGDTPAAAPSAEVSTSSAPPAKVLDRGQLESVLLAVGDMPTGYTRSAAEDDPEDPASVPDPETTTKSSKPECAALFDEFQGNRAAQTAAAAGNPAAAVEYEKSDLGPYFQHQLVSYPDRGAVDARMTKLAAAGSQCTEFTVDDGGMAYTVTVAPATFPTLGDQSTAYKVTAKGGTGDVALSMAGYLVGVRVGTTMATIVHFGLPDADPAETQTVARAATEKLVPVAR